MSFSVEKNTGLVGFVSNLNGNDGLALSSGNGDGGSFSLIGSPAFAARIILTGVRSIAGRNSRGNSNGNVSVYLNLSIKNAVFPSVSVSVISNDYGAVWVAGAGASVVKLQVPSMVHTAKSTAAMKNL